MLLTLDIYLIFELLGILSRAMTLKIVKFLIAFTFSILGTVKCNGIHVIDSQRSKDTIRNVNKRHVLESKRTARDPCKELSLGQLFVVKHHIEETLLDSLNSVQKDKSIEKKTRDRQIRAILLFRKEINETESLLYDSVKSLRRVLKGDYKSLRNLEKTSKQRLDKLKQATLEEEQEYKDILQAEKEEITELRRQGHNGARGQDTPLRKFINNLLSDISAAADKLELQLDDGSFEKKFRENNRNYAIETVLRLNEDDSTLSPESNGVMMLIDAHNNQYVLSRPKDGTITHVDSKFIRDVIYIVICSLGLSIPCSWFGLPNLIAYILTGIILGPSGINLLQSIVQVETLGEFGVFFILFVLGLEFSIEKMKKIWKTSFKASIIISAILGTIGLISGGLFGINPRQSMFIASCLSMSSTPIMSKIMSVSGINDQSKEHLPESGDDYINILYGIFIMQDVQIGLVMGILPILAGHYERSKTSFALLPNQGIVHYWLHGASHAGSKDFIDSTLTVFWSFFELIIAMALVVFISGFLATHLISRYFSLIHFMGKSESGVVGTITIVFSMLLMTDHLGISMELGCFVCGAVISSQGEQICKQASTFIEPVRDFFACIFFATIGLHVFPSFVFSEMAIMIPITAMIVIIKFSVASLVLSYLLPKGSQAKWMVASGLLQISEYAFVLGSRARRFDLISREVYLVILSVTMLSLVVGPFFWKMMTSNISWHKLTLAPILQLSPLLSRQHLST